MKRNFLCPALTLSFALASALTFLPGPKAGAEEGMWTFDNPPIKLLEKLYGFKPTQEWLDHIRLSSVRLNDGGSGSFVSPDGLLLTNHHVARGQLQKNSNAEHDYIRDGFYAATAADELRSPDLEVNVLVGMENVTEQVQGAAKGAADDTAALKAREAEGAKLQQECQQKTWPDAPKDAIRCDLVTLYQGGEYWIYRYHKYTDVRIVFAPEQQAAFYGGDPDNFTYPRYDIDFALFRVYENGQPVHPANYLKWKTKGAEDGELIFIPGHPGATSRQGTMAQLMTERDYTEPVVIEMFKSRIAAAETYAAKGTEQARQVSTTIFSLQNSLKAYLGRYQALEDKAVIAKKQAEEDDFRAKVNANPEWKNDYTPAWETISKAEDASHSLIKQQILRRTNSQLASYALTLVQFAAEIGKPDADRLALYHDANLPMLRFRVESKAPIYIGSEIAFMTDALTLAQKELGANDEFVASILNGGDPAAVAFQLLSSTKLGDPEYRKTLFEGGPAAINASTDPLIVLARKFDPIVRKSNSDFRARVTSVELPAEEKLGHARFLTYGKDAYPDATFTLRISYGTIKGYPMNGTVAPPFTTFYGLYDRSEGFGNKEPFNLPKRFSEGRDKLNLSTRVNFVSTGDIIGGNSGSPVVNKQGELVGLIFDGNIESLAGDFVYEGEKNRAVAVDPQAIIEVLRKLYGASALADELEGTK
jgi:hypothetical protein